MYETTRIKFVLPNEKHTIEAMKYIQEFRDYNSNINGSGGLNRYDDYGKWLVHTINSRTNPDNPAKVPATTFFAIDKVSNIIVGSVNIRHYLNDILRDNGWGHIGYGVRPTQRRKGYATEMLHLALQFCKKLGLEDVMVGCNISNIGSRRTIEKNGGVLLREMTDQDGNEEYIFNISI